MGDSAIKKLAESFARLSDSIANTEPLLRYVKYVMMLKNEHRCKRHEMEYIKDKGTIPKKLFK